MKFANILSVAALTIVAGATSAFAQDASAQLDMSQYQGGQTIHMGITEAVTQDGSAFAAGMVIDGEYGTGIVIDATVNRIEKEEFASETNAEGSLVSSEDKIEKTISASGTVNFGNKVENTDDIDGSEIEVEGNDTSSSVDL